MLASSRAPARLPETVACNVASRSDSSCSRWTTAVSQTSSDTRRRSKSRHLMNLHDLAPGRAQTIGPCAAVMGFCLQASTTESRMRWHSKKERGRMFGAARNEEENVGRACENECEREGEALKDRGGGPPGVRKRTGVSDEEEKKRQGKNMDGRVWLVGPLVPGVGGHERVEFGRASRPVVVRPRLGLGVCGRSCGQTLSYTCCYSEGRRTVDVVKPRAAARRSA